MPLQITASQWSSCTDEFLPAYNRECRTRRVVIVLVCFFASLIILGRSTNATGPNVLFLAADDLRCDLGCYGHPLVKTPNLDRLAERGILFQNAYCQQAVCNPSRASLLTGLRPDALKLWNLTKHFRDEMPDVVTLPQHFRQHGYFTQNIGKIFHNWRTEIKGDPVSWSVPAVMHYARHGDDKPQSGSAIPDNLASAIRCECRDLPDNAYFDGRIADLAVEAIRKRSDDPQPFFLAVGFWKPHLPFNAPKKYWDLYDRSNVDLPPNPDWPANAPRIAWHNSRELLGNPAKVLSDDDVRELRHGYLAAISYLDAQVGKVLDELERQQLADNTIIVFWSDHGFHLGEQSLWAKTSNFELDARVPLIIATPDGLSRGKTTASLVELLDLYPTLNEACSLPMPVGLQGKSLMPILKDPAKSVKRFAMTQHPRPAYYDKTMDAMGYSIRTVQYRYTEWRNPQSGDLVAKELYDHGTDPHETTNVVDDEKFSQTVRMLESYLAASLPVGRQKQADQEVE